LRLCFATEAGIFLSLFLNFEQNEPRVIIKLYCTLYNLLWSLWMNAKQLDRPSHQIFSQITGVIIALCKLCHHSDDVNYDKLSYTAEPIM